MTFSIFQWEWPAIIFIVYRLIAAGYITGWLVYTAVSMPVVLGHPWIAWLTNWSYLVLSLHLIVSLIITVIHSDGPCFRQPPMRIAVSIPPDEVAGIPHNSESAVSASATTYGTSSTSLSAEVEIIAPVVYIPWYIKIQWAFFAIISNFAFIVTLVFFVALFPYMNDNQFAFLIDFHVHALNSIVIVLELCISALPVRLLHVIYPQCYGLCYVIFSIIYWAVDHKNVLYPRVLDWNHPGTTVGVVLVLALVGLPLVQLILFGLYRLRLYLYNKVYSNRPF